MMYVSTLSMHKQTKWTVESTSSYGSKNKTNTTVHPWILSQHGTTGPAKVDREWKSSRGVPRRDREGAQGTGVVEGSLLIKIYV